MRRRIVRLTASFLILGLVEAPQAKAEAPHPADTVAPATLPDADVVTKARALDKYGDRAGALRLLARHLEKTPGDTVARALSGALLLADARYDAARAELALVLRASPGDAQVLREAIQIELRSGHPERAIELASAAIERDPKVAQLHVARGRAFAALGKLDEAVADLDRAVQLDPHDRDARRSRRWAHIAARVWAGAEPGAPPGEGAADAWQSAPRLLRSIPRALAVSAILQTLAVEEPGPDAAPPRELLPEVRSLAKQGDPKGALRILRWHLEAKPTDTDARTLYGTMLSWEGRYEEARAELSKVLQAIPGHGDAIRSAIHVELWSSHDQRALELATEALQREPDSTELLLDRVRALVALNRLGAAKVDLAHLAALDPENADASRLRRRVEVAGRVWGVSGTYTIDAFSDTFPVRHEIIVDAKRITPLGSVILRGYEAIRPQTVTLNDTQIEIEAFPSIRKGTYVDVGGAFAPSANLYPNYRLQIDVYQVLPYSFETSLGYRHLQFDNKGDNKGVNKGVDMGVLTLSRYIGDWLPSLRSFILPDVAGSSVSLYASVRRYLPDGVSYIGVRYGHGLAKDDVHSAADIALLQSNTGGAEASFLFSERFELGARASASQQTRTYRTDLWQYELTISVGLRL